MSRLRTSSYEEQLDDEIAQSADEAKAALAAKKAALQAKIDAAETRAKGRLESAKASATARFTTLQSQVEQASGEFKEKIARRLERAKVAHEEDSKRLGEAWAAVRDTLRP